MKKLVKCFNGLTAIEQKAIKRYLRELKRQFPEIARTAYCYRARDDIIYIRANLPRSDEEQMRIREVMSPVATDIAVKYRVALVLMPKLPWEQPNLQFTKRAVEAKRDNKRGQTLSHKKKCEQR